MQHIPFTQSSTWKNIADIAVVAGIFGGLIKVRPKYNTLLPSALLR